MHPLAASSLAVRVVTVESEHGPLDLVAVSTERPMDPRLFLASQGSPAQAWQSLDGGAVLLSEPLASRLGITSAGDAIDLLTPQGWQSFPIAGIYADYASTRGTVRMSLDVYRRLWQDDRLNGVVLLLKPGINVDEAAAGLRERLAGFAGMAVQPSAALRQEALVSVRAHLCHHHCHADADHPGGLHRGAELPAGPAARESAGDGCPAGPGHRRLPRCAA